MKNHERSGRTLVLATIFIIATLAIAGCTESAPDGQGGIGTTTEKQSMDTGAKTVTTMRTTSIPSQPAADPVLPGAVITFDPVGEKKTGDPLLITGTTSLPAGTNLFWQIRPDTANPPAGIDMDSRMGIMANNQVTKGSGTSNQVSLSVESKDTKDLTPGKYVIVIVSLKGDPMTTNPSTGTIAGYGYLTLK
jgi:hypothetical protein